jgi:hypothetical protein
MTDWMYTPWRFKTSLIGCGRMVQGSVTENIIGEFLSLIAFHAYSLQYGG